MEQQIKELLARVIPPETQQKDCSRSLVPESTRHFCTAHSHTCRADAQGGLPCCCGEYNNRG